ncbi:MAG: GTPase ObgE [Chloroflexota bacterium]
MPFDNAKINVAAGKGGDGAVSFRREKFVPYGGPDGGDGGRGGSIYVVGEPSLSTLGGFDRKRHFKAGNGGKGMGRKKHGARGEELHLPVPLGTIVRVEDGETLGEILEPGQELLVARGGRGGLGNTHFATSTNQVPRIAQHGEPGEERWLTMEMKLIADIGIIGFPNAGKSTFLAAVSHATPKIADYPFTTIIPNLGVVVLNHDAFVLADIPGLIEGAHLGRGLGHDFLRHIERTKVLVHLVDGNEPDVRAAYEQVNGELALFEPPLDGKPQLVAINKIDEPAVRDHLSGKLAALGDLPWPVFAISALGSEGVQDLLRRAYAELQRVRAVEAATRVIAVPAEGKVFRPLPTRALVAVVREEYGWRVHSPRGERLAVMTDVTNDLALRLLHKHLRRIGVSSALERAGAKPGDLVRIGPVDLAWGGDAPPKVWE